MSSRFCAVSQTSAVDDTSDLILPCQYHDLSGGRELLGEQRLMLALLTDAINVYQRGAMSAASHARRLFVDADQWIMSDRDSSEAFSFEMVCDALGINAAQLRRRLLDWKHAVRRQYGSQTSSRLRLRILRRERHSSHRRGRPPANATLRS